MPSPLSHPTVAWPRARSWEEPATHSGLQGEECKQQQHTQTRLAPQLPAQTTLINSKLPNLEAKILKRKDTWSWIGQSNLSKCKSWRGELEAVLPRSRPGTDTTAGLGVDWFDVSLQEKVQAEIWNCLTWRVPHVQLNPVLVYLETGCVVLKHCGYVVLKIRDFLLVIQLGGTW